MNHIKVTLLRDAIAQALKTIEKDHGVTLDLGRARFSGTSVRFQFNLVENDVSVDGTTVKVPLMVDDFRKNHYRYGLELKNLGANFICDGKIYTVVGSKRSRHKYPILATNIQGKQFKFTASAVKTGLTKLNSK